MGLRVSQQTARETQTDTHTHTHKQAENFRGSKTVTSNFPMCSLVSVGLGFLLVAASQS
jgi:hypothetical protein